MELQELLDEMAKREPPRIQPEDEDRGAPAPQEALVSSAENQEASPIGDSSGITQGYSPVTQGYSPDSPEASDLQPASQKDAQELPAARPEYEAGLDGTGESLSDPEPAGEEELGIDAGPEPEIPEPSSSDQPQFPSYDLPVSMPSPIGYGNDYEQESPIGYQSPFTSGGQETAEVSSPIGYGRRGSQAGQAKDEPEPFDNARFVSDLGAELSPKFDELAYNLSANSKDFVNQRILEITMLGDS